MSTYTVTVTTAMNQLAPPVSSPMVGSYQAARKAFQSLHMAWVVVTDGRGTHRPQMRWQVD